MVKEAKAVKVESEHEIWADDILKEFGIEGRFIEHSWDKKRNMLRLIVKKDDKHYTHEIPIEEIAKRWGFPKGVITNVYVGDDLVMIEKPPFIGWVDYLGFTIKEKAVGKLKKIV